MNQLANFCDKLIKTCLYLLFFALPIFFLPWTFEVMEFNKQNLLIVLTLLAGLAWLGKMLVSKKIILRKSFLNLLVLLYAVIYILAAIFSSDRFRSFVGASGVEKDGLITVLCFVLLYFVVINNVKEIKIVKNLVRSLVLGSAAAAVFALFGSLGFLPQSFLPSGFANTVGTASAFGIFLAAIFILVSSLFLKTEKEKNPGTKKSAAIKILLVLFSGLVVFLLAAIDNWLIWASFVPALALFLAFAVLRVNAIKNLGWLALPMAALALAILFFFVRTPLRFNFPAEIMPSFSASGQIAKQTLQEAPLFGSGPATFAFDYGKYKPESVNETPLWNIKFDRSASRILTILTTTGLLGLIAWLFLAIFFVVKSFVRLIKEKNAGLWLSQLGIFAAWFLLFAAKFMYSSNLTLEFLFWALTALFVVLTSDKFWEINLSDSPRASLLLSFILTLSVIFSVSTFYLLGQRYAANVKFTEAVAAVSRGEDLNKTVELFDKAASLDRQNDVYARNLAQNLLAKVNVELGAKPSEESMRKLQNLVAADIGVAKRATELGPANSANWSALASIYQTIMPIIPGADEWAITSWQKAIELEPANPFFYTEFGKVYFSVADLAVPNLQSSDEKIKKEAEGKINENLAKAEEQFNKAVELKNDYAPAHFQLALVYSRQGKIGAAIDKLEIMKGDLPNDLGVIFQLGLLYYQNKEQDKAVVELKRAIELAPDFANARWYLAAVHEEQNKNGLAISQLEEILKTDPENETVQKKIEALKNPSSEPSAPLPEPIP